MRRPASLAFATALALAPGLDAQPANLLGRALLPDSVTPARGAIIEAASLDAPSTRVRAMVGSNGSFLLNLPRGGAWRLSGMRVGFLPTPLGTFTARATEQTTLPQPLVLGAIRVTLTLASLQVDTSEICGRGPDDSQRLVATLLAQARSALAATALASPDGAATAEWQRFSLFTDRTGTPLTPMRIERFSAATDRPMRAVNADSLARFGYLWDRTDHVQFNAPDAEVLLSESFVGSHCYRLSAPHPGQPEWVGVAFVPAQQRRGIVEVRGTLWLDRATSELRQLEYVYVDLPEKYEAASPRGLVEFARLPGDIWAARRWEMRLPRAGNVVARNGTVPGNPVSELNAIQITGGDVSKVSRGDELLFRSDTDPSDRFPEVVARLGAAPSCVDSPKLPSDESGIVYGTISDSLGRPVRGMARLNWTAIGRQRGTNFQRERNVSAVDGFFFFCNISVGPTLTLLTFDADGKSSEPIRFRLQLRQPWAAMHRTIGR